MGAWDVGPFDNDDALDWTWQLDDATDFAVVRRALDVPATGHLEAPDGAEAVAAAEVVAASLGRPPAAMPDSVSSWVREYGDRVGDDERRAAVAAVDRVLSDESELRELWDEADEDWVAVTEDLATRLRGA